MPYVGREKVVVFHGISVVKNCVCSGLDSGGWERGDGMRGGGGGLLSWAGLGRWDGVWPEMWTGVARQNFFHGALIGVICFFTEMISFSRHSKFFTTPRVFHGILSFSRHR